jgi:hypothetical protein
MKPLKSLLSIAFSLTGLLALAQGDITNNVADAIKKGDASALSQYFMSPVDLTIDDLEGSFSKADAKSKLTAFFAQHPPKDFIVKHQGTSKLDDQFRIGDLFTPNGNYRIIFFMKYSGNTMLIRQLKIEAL